MIIRLTSKLAKKIGTKPEQCLTLDINPYLDWAGHLFTAQRLQYIILTNSVSLYSIIMHGRGVSSEQKFVKRAMNAMEEFMCRDGFEFVFRRLIAPYCRTIIMSKVTDKKLLGSIVEMTKEAQFWLAERELSPFDSAARINTSIFSYLQYNTPKEAFTQLKPSTA